MIPGLQLPALAERVMELNRRKLDYRAPVNRLLPRVVDGRMELEMQGDTTIRARVNDHAARQMTEYLGIPGRYAETLATEQPTLLEHNLQRRMSNAGDDRRTLRMYADAEGGHTLRAFLSNSYRPLDNIDLMTAISGKFAGTNLRVHSSQVTDKRLYIQAVRTDVQFTVESRQVGDIISPGIVVSNSEVGSGSLRVEMLLFRVACLNGAIVGDSIRKNHVGKRGIPGSDVAEQLDYSDGTRALIDAAFWAQVSETVDNAMDEQKFLTTMKRVNALPGIEVPRPNEAVENVTKEYGLSIDEKESVLRNLIQGGDSSMYGLWNAVTQTAEQVTSYDRAIEIERIGGDFLASPAKFARS
jgi:Domain of unknown function (DUF932)